MLQFYIIKKNKFIILKAYLTFLRLNRIIGAYLFEYQATFGLYIQAGAPKCKHLNDEERTWKKFY